MITKEEREYLIEAMSALLSEYGYKYTEKALNKIIDRWAERKAALIEGFKTHPNYVPGQFMIAFKQKFERAENTYASKKFGMWLKDYPVQECRNIPADIKAKTENGNYIPWDLWYFFRDLDNYATQFVSEETAAKINEMIPALRVRAGQKTSKVVNKMCKYLGYDKHPDYNREYAKYSDSLNPITFERNTILSINPLDYLTMSFGNSWASCHTIDKANKRGMPNNYSGCYSTGTMSYMLDGVSMVFYTVDNSYDGIEYWNQPKINRQMFHYGEEKMIQGRLYPQDNDGCSTEYTAYRNIAQSIVSTAFGFPNLWTLKTGTDNTGKYTYSLGTHYRDYNCYGNCSVSLIKGSENQNKITIGANPVCVRCGEEHNWAENIDHCIYKKCTHCGDWILEDNAIEIDGKYYCKHCVFKCPICGKYHLMKDIVTISWSYAVCRDCFNEHYTRCGHCNNIVKKEDAIEIDGKYYHKDCVHKCPICGELHPGNGVYVVGVGYYVCNACVEGFCVRCEHCGEYTLKKDVVELNGKHYCVNCVHYCNICKKHHVGSSTYIYGEDINVCRKCRDEYFALCDHCDDFVRNEDITVISGTTYCKSCLERKKEREEKRKKKASIFNDLYTYYTRNNYIDWDYLIKKERNKYGEDDAWADDLF